MSVRFAREGIYTQIISKLTSDKTVAFQTWFSCNVILNLLQSIAAAAAFYYSEALLLYYQLLILTVLGAIGTLAFCVVEWGVSRAYRMGYQSIWPQVRAFCWWLRGDECFTFSSVCWPFLHPPEFKMMWSCANKILIDVINATTSTFLKKFI